MEVDIGYDIKKRELFANKISFYACLIIFIFSLIVGIISDSITLLLDSADWLVDFIAGIFTHYIIINIHKTADSKYHYGYAKYEPLAVTIEGVLILSSCLMSIKFAIQDIVHPDEVKSYDLALILTVITGFVGLGMNEYLKRLGRKLNSSILISLGLSWKIATVSSFGIFVGFVIGKWLSLHGYNNIANYVDPVMAIILAASLLVSPLRLIKESMLELLDANPGESIEEPIKEAMEGFRNKYNLPQVKHVRLRKAGRKIFIDACFFADASHTVEQVTNIANEFRDCVAERFTHMDITVSFDVS